MPAALGSPSCREARVSHTGTFTASSRASARARVAAAGVSVLLVSRRRNSVRRSAGSREDLRRLFEVLAGEIGPPALAVRRQPQLMALGALRDESTLLALIDPSPRELALQVKTLFAWAHRLARQRALVAFGLSAGFWLQGQYSQCIPFSRKRSATLRRPCGSPPAPAFSARSGLSCLLPEGPHVHDGVILVVVRLDHVDSVHDPFVGEHIVHIETAVVFRGRTGLGRRRKPRRARSGL